MSKLLLRTMAAGLLFLAAACAGAPDAGSGGEGDADLVVVGGSVWTGVDGAADAEAVAVRDGRLVAVGTRAEIEALVGSGTRVIDAAGGMVVPGFIDTHIHFLDGGFNLTSVQLRDASTPEEFISRIRDFAATQPEGEWILGGDWDHTLWGGELPRRQWIDSVTPNNPVWINRLDGHMALANTAALEAAGVTAATAEIEGGEIVRDANGEPTGLLRDNAMGPVSSVVPATSEETSAAALEAAMNYVAANGVTTVHHVGNWSDLAVFRRAHDAGDLRTRIYAATPLSQWERLRDDVSARGTGDDWLRTGALKGFIDGSLGSHTAAFDEPFTDDPDSRGLLVNTPEDLHQWVLGADAAGLHVFVHAIGDRANALVLDTFEEVIEENGARDRRFRIEHAQHLRPEDVERFAALDVIASMQPYHAIDDGRWAEEVIGPERARTTYAFRSLLDAGVVVAFGSDWSVAPATPLDGIYGAVTRRTLDGANPEGWVPEQKISVEEALHAYTTAGAYAAYEEDLKGTLEAGKLGDLVVLDRDLRAIAPEEIRDVRVIATVVGGEVVHDGGS